jgi:tetratricopeptide (TPR) repeat protein
LPLQLLRAQELQAQLRRLAGAEAAAEEAAAAAAAAGEEGGGGGLDGASGDVFAGFARGAGAGAGAGTGAGVGANAGATSASSAAAAAAAPPPFLALDAFLLYLLGVVLRELERREEARAALLAAARAMPLLWSAWADLAGVCGARAELDALDLPRHWAARFFGAHALLELQASSLASLRALQPLSAAFPRAHTVRAMAARALYNMRRFDQAQALLEGLRAEDPHRLEDADVLSNILYVRGESARLAALAHEGESECREARARAGARARALAGTRARAAARA